MRGFWRSCPGASRWRTGRLSAAQKVSVDCVVRATFLKRRRRHQRTFPRLWGTISAEALDVRLIRNSIFALSHNPVLWDIEKDVEGGTAQMRARLTNDGIFAARAGGRVQSWQRCMGRRTTFSQQCVCKKGSTSQSARVARQCAPLWAPPRSLCPVGIEDVMKDLCTCLARCWTSGRGCCSHTPGTSRTLREATLRRWERGWPTR